MSKSKFKSYILAKITWLEKKVGLDIMYYIKNAPFLITITLISTLFGLISSMALARITSQESYGTYIYVLTVLSLLSIFSITGMNTAIQRAASRSNDKILTEGTKSRFKWSLLGSIVIFAISMYYFYSGNIILGKCFLFSTFIFPFYASFDSFLYFFMGKMKFNLYTLNKSILLIFPVIMILVILTITNDILWIIVVYLSSYTIIQLYLWNRTLKTEKLNDKLDNEEIKYGKVLTLQGLIPTIVNQLDTIVIGNFLSLSQLAIFSIAVYVQNFAQTPRGILMDLIFPKIARMDNHSSTKIVLEKVKYVLIISIIISAIFAVIIPFIIPLIYSNKYSDSIFLSELLLISEIVSAPGGVFTQALKAQRRSKDLWNLNISSRGIQAILIIVLIPLLGLLGAVVVRIIYGILVSFIAYYIIKSRKNHDN